jgi:ribonucleotide reductase alpha subunit
MEDNREMQVIKRNGKSENIAFDKILKRVKTIGQKRNLSLNYTSFVMKVIDQLYDGITTTKIDELTAEQCASLTIQHPDYGVLASEIIISNHQKNTSSNFYSAMKQLYYFKDIHNKNVPLISDSLWKVVSDNKDELNSMIDYDRDFFLDYFGFKTLERSYLMRVNKKIVERPQHLWLRVSLGIHGYDLDKVKKSYDYMSQKYFTHATPTLFNAGTPRPQLSSCYLLAMENDSVDGIYNTLRDCARISKWAGGIGLHIHNIRACGSHIRGTNGISNGIAPMLRVFNNTARYIDQGGGKRSGSFAIYMEPWHSDIEIFLDLRKNHGDEEMRARDLFYALWVPDIFMKRVKENSTWTLMCPDECPGLSDVYGENFDTLYMQYEKESKGKRVINARDLWFKILDSQMETGTPYLLYKDTCNKKSNQQNIGTIKSSNLCTEIIEYSDSDETAVCNLASIALSKFVNDDKTFNYEMLHEVTQVVTENLNKVIDINFYPTVKTKRSNMRHRPIGIGVQGLADTFAMMDIAFESEEAVKVNKDIFETIYHASVSKSNDISRERYQDIKTLQDVFIADLTNDSEEFNKKVYLDWFYDMLVENYYDAELIYPFEGKEIVETTYHKVQTNMEDIFGSSFYKRALEHFGSQKKKKEQLSFTQVDFTKYKKLLQKKQTHGAYSTFEGSPISKGVFQFNLWDVEPSTRYDWTNLASNIGKYGIRNSLLVAPMPTASTSQILGNNECFEPFTSNIYTRRTLAGEFVIVNKHLIQELIDLNIWNESVKNSIIEHNGSVQQLTNVPENIRNKYKTVWEISMKHLINMSRDRGAFICQSQSLNLWLKEPNYNNLTSMHFYSWSQGLKTGIYYLRRQAKHQAQQFTIEPTKQNSNSNADDNEVCEMCSA